MKIISFLLLFALSVASTSRPPPDVVITGTVVNEADGAVLAGAQVSVTAFRTAAAVTDARGRFTISLVGEALIGGTVEVRVRMVGYETVTRSVELAGAAVTVNFGLKASVLTLDEVVVSGAEDATRQRAEVRGSMSAPVAYRQVAGAAIGFTYGQRDRDRESYAFIDESGFRLADAEPLSTFSIDVDRASYSNVRRFINEGTRPPIDAVRIEELINYFPYDYDAGDGEHPFGVTTEIMAAPWNSQHRLARVGLQARHIDLESAPPSNLVFLLDVSGSMGSPDKLPLLKRSLGLLVNELRETDRVAIVVYAGAPGLVLPSTPGTGKQRILDALENLHAGGSTAGGAGIQLAYRVAQENFIRGGNNRVILATDGDFNVGASSDAEMIRLIEKKRDQGTFLTVLGFGTGNLQDAKMEQIADHGNGNFAYIDNLLEARKVLVTEMGGTLLTVAKDVKLQVEFNPARVQAYRLIGYENRLLAAEDFNDDTKDAGELGAGHSVTALYEIVPHGVPLPDGVTQVDSLRYRRPAESGVRTESDELFFVKVRYKAPDGDRSRLLQLAAFDSDQPASDDLRFAAAVAGFGMILRDSRHCAEWTMADVSRMAFAALGEDPNGYRAGFVQLVERVQQRELLSVR